MLRSTIGGVVFDLERVDTSMDKSCLCNWVGYRAGILLVGGIALVSSLSSPKASPSGSSMW
jgi:hypothetical protein